MSVAYEIHPKSDVVVIRYWGHATVPETISAFRNYLVDPDYRPGQKQLFDVRDVTSVDRNYLEFFRMQAEMVESYGTSEHDQLAVFLVSGEAGHEMANMALKSWEKLGRVMISICEEHDAALDILGLSRLDFDGVGVGKARD